ncbi:MAG: hypothetical protein JJ975_03330 [Bacteroidia bacterium]|nr:hypothetical protein [Bacteroidia bacterium]
MNLKNYLCLVILCFSLNVFGQIPNVIPYQGHIADTSGKGYDGNFDFSFTIKDNSGSQLWTSGTISVPVDDGAYSVSLGESPQTALTSSIWQNDILFLEISFDDGVNGSETLSPNVQILPVPYALRAAIADSAANTNGQLGWGDSLVLRDASGDKRFVLNPNTGEFKIMQDDTIWYEVESNSPPKTNVSYGDNSLTTEYVRMNGKDYTKNTRTKDGYTIERFEQHSTDAGNNDTMNFTRTLDKNKCVVSATYKVFDKKRGRVKVCTYSYKCPGGDILSVKCKTLAGATPDEPDVTDNKETDTKTEEKTEDGKLQMVTVDTRTGNEVKTTSDAKDSCFVVEASKIVLKTANGEYVVKVDKDGKVKQEAKKNGGDGLIIGMDDENNELSIEDSLILKYRFISPTQIRMLVQELGVQQAKLYFEQLDLENKEIVTGGLENLKRLVDSVFKHKIVSQKTKDSIEVLYNAFGHFIQFLDVEEFKELNQHVERIRTYEPGKVIEEDTDVATGASVKTTRDLQEGKDIIEGLKGNDIIMSDTPYVTTYKYDVTSSTPVEVKTNPVSSTVTYDGLDRVVRENDSEQHHDIYDGKTHQITRTHNVKDSSITTAGATTYFYDGLDRIVTKSEGEITHEYDAANSIIEETYDPDDNSLEYDGLFNRHHRIDTNAFVESFVDGNNRELSVLYEPSDSIINYSGVRFVEWQFDNNITVLTSLGPGQSSLANFDPGTNSGLGITLNQSDRVIQMGDPFGGKIPVQMDSLFAMDFGAVNGNFEVNGNLSVNGNISKQSGSFRIDHPQDPYNKYLVHSFVESPDMMNVYNGNIITDSSGTATVDLPGYFESLNMDFRYQLTCIGTFAQAIVLEKVNGNQFKIQTDKPGVEVSWQVTGIRKDPFANDNRLEVEQEKEEGNKGTLLYKPTQTNKK